MSIRNPPIFGIEITLSEAEIADKKKTAPEGNSLVLLKVSNSLKRLRT
ncbi:hypothetical protein AB1K32_25410 [Metabacillus dongyingensis]